MFGAIGRWFKALGYLLTGRIDSARRVIDTNPHVIRAKYDEIVKEKISQIHIYKQAVAKLIAQQENKMAKVKNLTGEIEKLERLKAGALAKAKERVGEMSGKPKAEVQADEEYMKCLGAYNNFSSTLAEKPNAAVPSSVPMITKGGLEAITRSLAIEFAKEGIRVNAVAPGAVETPMHENDPKDFMKTLAPMGRISSIRDIVDAVLYLTEAANVTGEILRVDGGSHVGKW